MQSQADRIILPFHIPSENRKLPFGKEMEQSAVVCIAEAEREKGGGIILKQPPEEIGFIAEMGYPFWLVPNNGTTLVFDGMNMISHKATFKSIPDVETLLRSAQNRFTTLETYEAFLAENSNYFKSKKPDEEVAFNGLISDPQILSEFATYLQDQSIPPTADIALLSPQLDEALSNTKQEISALTSRLKEEVVVLYATLKFLNKTTGTFTKTIRAKIRGIQEEYAQKIKDQESIVAPKIDEIRLVQDEEVARLTKEFEAKLQPLRKEKVRLEKAEEEAHRKIEEYKLEAKTRKANKDQVGERKWKEKTSETKKRLGEINSQTKTVNRQIKETEGKKSAEIFKLRTEGEAKIAEVKKDLIDLEADRDAKIQVHKQEIEKLKELTMTMIEQIDTAAKLREANISELDHIGIKFPLSNHAIAYIEFWMIQYKSERGKRYFLIPPSQANTPGLSIKLKGVLGMSKIRQALSPRFDRLTTFLCRLPMLVEENAVLEREIVEGGEKANLLNNPATPGNMKKGIQLLKEEGWLSDKECEGLWQTLTSVS